MPPIRMKGDGRKAKDPKKTLARLFSYTKPYLGTMILVVICILVASMATALSSYSLDPLINNYIIISILKQEKDKACLIFIFF